MSAAMVERLGPRPLVFCDEAGRDLLDSRWRTGSGWSIAPAAGSPGKGWPSGVGCVGSATSYKDTVLPVPLAGCAARG